MKKPVFTLLQVATEYDGAWICDCCFHEQHWSVPAYKDVANNRRLCEKCYNKEIVADLEGTTAPKKHKSAKLSLEDRNCIYREAAELSDAALERLAYHLFAECCGSEAEMMEEQCWDEADIAERRKCEGYDIEVCNVIEELCSKRGIQLWTAAEDANVDRLSKLIQEAEAAYHHDMNVGESQYIAEYLLHHGVALLSSDEEA